MSDKTTDDKKIKQPAAKHKFLLVVSILELIDSTFSIALTAFIIVMSIISAFAGKLTVNINLSSLQYGVSAVFGIVLCITTFYAALRGIWQDKLIKCRKLGIVLILLNAVSCVSDLFGVISFNSSIQNIILQIIFYTAISLLLPVLYLISANLALKKQAPKSKYESIIDAI